ncbi:MAG: GNAT family N-acetyltransferase [Bacteroidales bacterium]|jgi:hypothetical protein|nr:GNAT family N-acetyltransferase [Bacteroidales bacterium]
MKQLTNTLQEMYGLHFRFVNEDDAQFILKLRTNPHLSRYIHSTLNDLKTQKEWIRRYKEREEKGEEYYFIFFKDKTPVGLNRIYNIQNKVFTTGSWIFDKSAPLECAVISALIVRIVAFEWLGMELENGFDGCHENNKTVLKFNRMLGLQESGKIIDYKGTYITMTLTKADFEKNKEKFIRLLNLE